MAINTLILLEQPPDGASFYKLKLHRGKASSFLYFRDPDWMIVVPKDLDVIGVGYMSTYVNYWSYLFPGEVSFKEKMMWNWVIREKENITFPNF